MNRSVNFSAEVLRLDAAQEVERIETAIHQTVRKVLRRRGAVVGVSGGIDSALSLTLASRTLGSSRVTAVLMPDRESHPSSAELARQVADQCGVSVVVEDLTPALEALGCYRRRDDAVRTVMPNYDPVVDRIKLILPSGLDAGARLNVYSLVLMQPGKEPISRLAPPSAYLEIVAAMNMKQRVRMLTLYYYAERNHWAVIGTANKNEHEQGFFVKYGDGGVDLQPISHLYKTQVYQLAEHLGVPQQIIERKPTTDTYSAESTQEEFYFRLPFRLMDLIWYAYDHGVSAATAANTVGLSVEQVEFMYRDLKRKAQTTDYLRLPPIVIPLQ